MSNRLEDFLNEPVAQSGEQPVNRLEAFLAEEAPSPTSTPSPTPTPTPAAPSAELALAVPTAGEGNRLEKFIADEKLAALPKGDERGILEIGRDALASGFARGNAADNLQSIIRINSEKGLHPREVALRNNPASGGGPLGVSLTNELAQSHLDAARANPEQFAIEIRDADSERENALQEQVASLQSFLADANSVKPSVGLQRFAAADGIVDSTVEFFRNPLEIASNVIGESLGGGAKGIAATAVSGGFGRLALIATSGVTGGRTDYVLEVMSGLQEQGVDIGDPSSVDAFAATPEGHEFFLGKERRAAVIGLASLLGTAVATTPLVGGSTSATAALKEGAAQFAVGSTLEGAGEAGGQLAEKGELDGKEIALEVIGGGSSQVAETAGATIVGAKNSFAKPNEVPAEVAAQQETIRVVQKKLDELTQTAEEAEALVAAANEELVGLEAIPERIQQTEAFKQMVEDTTPARAATPFEQERVRSQVVDAETGLPIEGTELNAGQVSISQAVDPQFTVEGQLVEIEQVLQTAQQDYEAAKLAGNGDTLDFHAMQVQDATNELQTLQDASAAQEIILTKGRSLLQEWTNTLLPNVEIVLGTGAVSNALHFDPDSMIGRPNANRSLGVLTTLNDNFTKVAIDVNPVTMVRRLQDAQVATEERVTRSILAGDPEQAPNFAAVNEKLIIENLAHEFGHALTGALFRNAPESIRAAVYSEYHKAIGSIFDKGTTLAQEIKTRRGPAFVQATKQDNHGTSVLRSMIATKPARRTIGNLAEDQQAYYLSFDEWMADMIMRSLTGADQSNPSIVSAHFGRSGKVLERFWSRFHKQWNAPSQETISEFIQNTARNVEIERTTRELQGLQTELESLEATALEATSTTLRAFQKHFKPKDKELKQLGKETQQHFVRFNRFKAATFNLLQIAQQNQHIQPLQDYVTATREWWKKKNLWAFRTEQISKAWDKLGAEADQISKLMYSATLRSDELGRALTNSELAALIDEEKLAVTEEGMEVFNSVQSLFKDLLGYDENGVRGQQGLYHVALRDLQKSTIDIGNTATFQTQLAALNEEFRQLANRTYFPLMRFGKHVVIVRALEDFTLDGVDFKIGETVFYENYESKAEARQAQAQHQNSLGNKAKAKLSKNMATEDLAMTSLPPRLIAQLDKDLALSTEQKDALGKLSYGNAPSQTYKRFLLKRKNTQGFSQDAMRSFAAHVQNMGNGIARAAHMPEMRQHQAEVQAFSRKLDDESQGLELAKWLKDHTDYLANPGNDYNALKSVGFFMWMGWNVKSAYVNLTQIPMVTYPYLASNQAINKGNAVTRDAKAVRFMTNALNDTSPSRWGSRLSSLDQEMISVLEQEGILSETLAVELAGLANQDNLNRATIRNPATRRVAKAGEFTLNKAGAMMGAVEKYNRHATAVAAFRMGLDAGLTPQDATVQARMAVDQTQFEYAKWNRAKFQRGLGGVFFMFLTHTQNILFNMLGGQVDKGFKTRIWLMTLLMVGTSGLPGADLLEDLISAAGNKLNFWKDTADLRFDLGEFLEEKITELDDPYKQFLPDQSLINNGLSSRFGLGPLHLLEFAGIPIPEVDISGSLTLGNLSPQLQGLGDLITNPDTDRALANAPQSFGGPVFGLAANWYKALGRNDIKAIKRWQQVLPAAAASQLKAYQALTEGEFTNLRGVTQVKREGAESEFIADVVAQSFGFRPARLSKVSRELFESKNNLRFYAASREHLTNDFTLILQEEFKGRDMREARADWSKSLARFNSSLAKAGLGVFAINKSDLQKSVRNFVSRVKEEKLGSSSIRAQGDLQKNLSIEARKAGNFIVQEEELK